MVTNLVLWYLGMVPPRALSHPQHRSAQAYVVALILLGGCWPSWASGQGRIIGVREYVETSSTAGAAQSTLNVKDLPRPPATEVTASPAITGITGCRPIVPAPELEPQSGAQQAVPPARDQPPALASVMGVRIKPSELPAVIVENPQWINPSLPPPPVKVNAATPLDLPQAEPQSTLAKQRSNPPLGSATQQPVDPPAKSPADDWRLVGTQLWSLRLADAIQTSLLSKRVLHTLGSDVVVETTTTLDPAIAAQQITLAESRFDPVASAQFATNHIDRPPSAFFGAGIPVANRRDEIEFNARISKLWASGASTSLGYEPSLAYLFFPDGNPGGFNPTQSSDLVLQAVQPLGRGGGSQANLAGIRIVQHRESQSRLDVQAKLQQQLLGIETAYWQLHAGHVRRRAIIDALQLSNKIVELEKLRFEAGRVIYADVARAGVKLEDLNQQKYLAEQSIQQLSLQLAQLTGMDVVANNLLAPADPPQRQPPQFDFDTVVAVALRRNPDLLRRQHEISIRQNELQVARNQLRPQLDLRTSLRSSGLDNEVGTAFGEMAKIEYVDLSVGLVYTRPIGNRAAQSQFRQAELEAARTAELLAAFERKAAFDIADALNSLQLSYAGFESAVRQLEHAQEWVRLASLRYESPPDESGQEALLVALLDYQAAIQSQIDALVATASALATYNIQLAAVEERRGTLLDRWNISY